MRTNSCARIEVVLGCAQPMAAIGLSETLRAADSVRTVTLSGDAKSLLADCTRARPCVLIADVETLDDPMMTLPALSARGASAIVYGGATSPRMVAAWLRAGARGHLQLADGSEAVLRAVESVAAGRLALEPTLQVSVTQHLLEDADRPANGPALSAREREVLRMIAEGRTTSQVARLLTLEESTVKTHLKRIGHKLGTSNRAASVAEALRREAI